MLVYNDLSVLGNYLSASQLGNKDDNFRKWLSKIEIYSIVS